MASTERFLQEASVGWTTHLIEGRGYCILQGKVSANSIDKLRIIVTEIITF